MLLFSLDILYQYEDGDKSVALTRGAGSIV